MKITTLSSICLLLFCLSAPAADELTDPSDLRQLADQSMALFKSEQFAEGYGVLKQHWTLPPVEIDSLVNQTTTQWPIVRGRYGASLATEFIQQDNIGESFMRFTYLQKFEHHAIRWIFIFYKPRDRWIVNAVSFDDDIDSMYAQD